MKAIWEKNDNNTGVLTVEVDADRVNGALNQAFKKVVGKVSIPGFRKGKVPRALFEKRFGVESLYEDAVDILLRDVYREAIMEVGVEPISQPDISIEQFGKDQEMKFTAKLQVEPEVTLGEYKGLEVEVASAEVTDEDVQQELERLQKRHAELVVIDEGAAQEGDVVVIDFEGFLNNEPFDGGKAEKYELELGSGSFIPGFEEQLVGMEHGDEKEVNVTFPEEYHSEDLKGQTVMFKVKLHDIKRKNLPAIDDEFAKDVSEFDTIDEYRTDLKRELQERKTAQAKTDKENAIIEKAASAATVDIPDLMIDNDVDSRIHDLEHRLQAQGLTLDLYFQIYGSSREQMEESLRADANARVRNSLVLRAIAEAEQLQVSDEEIDQELQQIAEANQLQVEEVRKQMKENGNLDMIKRDLIVKQAVNFLVENNSFVEK